MKGCVRLLFMMATLWLAGCAGPRIDGTSEESLVQTIDQVRASLPEDLHSQFNEALMLVAFSQIGQEYVAATSPEELAAAAEQVRTGLDSLSANQILRQARVIRAREQKMKSRESHHETP
ncbi:DUF6694 family lipoprotein [uncultured Alcanivorax sp.]|jgi:hypothetical protein|uniref:DUF6694 family lipoprotein n=2 Tax=Alcanivorax TaxID=59753 RepID=UPI0034339F6A|tara:strand:- start:2337 stop:2696 length:360 start_codon:yes stop_codon:yes gene_type:complete